ncbi:MAG TPA: sensor histidine kinase [Verrucomicrobiae bacterium]|nr:sensor histidine kinase [Verrucomicrobiae bacterium]
MELFCRGVVTSANGYGDGKPAMDARLTFRYFRGSRSKRLDLLSTVLITLLMLAAPLLEARASRSTPTATNLVEIQSVTVKDTPVSITAAKQKPVRLPPFAEDVTFNFGFITSASRPPTRLSCKLEGFDNNWDLGGGEMYVVIRFYNKTGDMVAATQFQSRRDSAGWHNNFDTSTLTHRRETVVVPPDASRLLFVVTSAGPQSTEGVYVLTDLNISEASLDGSSKVLLQFPNDKLRYGGMSNSPDAGWIRDGTTPRMAKIVEFGQSPTTKALALMDDDPRGHAEWHNNLEQAPTVTPGDRILMEWNEMFSIGESGMHIANYPQLPPGNYLFRVREVNLMELPTGVETSLAIIVPVPYWKTTWFWIIAFLAIITLIMGAWRYFILIGTQRDMLRLEKQRLLEHERVRIARDIHDDLGARVTKISLVSALARDNSDDAKRVRGDLEQITQMSRDLITALYETVWAVDPDNDNLKELGNYIFQMVNDMCEGAEFCCRFHIGDLSREIGVSSQVRHNLCMAVKEAVNNVIKHAQATEVTVRISYKDTRLTVSVQDNGRGFDVASTVSGHGLQNIKGRLGEITGDSRIESQPGQGTTIWIYVEVAQCQWSS